MPEVEQQLVEAFKAHLDVEGANLEKMVNNFLSFLRWKPFTLYDRKKDLEALDRFILGLSHLDKRVYDSLSISARKRLDSRLGLGADYSDEGILDFMQRSEERHVRLFMDLLAHASELRTLVAAARKDIEVSERTRRTLSVINVDRLHVVALAAPLWAARNRQDLPAKGIKETHALARFLAVLFGILGIDTSPTKAYDSWLELDHTSPLHQN